MARIKINFHRRLPASTLMEAVIAMVIIILVFGLAMMIYINVTRLALSAKKLRAQAILQDLLIQAANTGNNSDRSVQTGEFRIEQKIIPFQQEQGLTEIVLTAFGNDREQVAQLQQIICNENNNR